jgi:hypothetical protein
VHRPTGSRCNHSRADRGDEELVQRVPIPFLFTTEHTEHTEINPPAVKLSFRVFGVFRGSLLFGDKSEYVVAAPQYRAAANTAMGWKNSNLLTELRMEN